MVEERKYEKFNPAGYKGKRESQPSGLEISQGTPKRIDDVIGEIEKAVTESDVSKEYKQTGGQ